MIAPPVPYQEAERLQSLYSLQVLGTPAEEPFDGIAEVAASLFKAPIALLTFIDAEQQWFKANVGAPMQVTPRELAFCSHAILSERTMVVEDMTKDARFLDHPYVTGPFGVRFYAGAPLITHERQCVGTLCLMDTHPRTFDAPKQRLLERMARQAMDALEMRKLVRTLMDGLG